MTEMEVRVFSLNLSVIRHLHSVIYSFASALPVGDPFSLSRPSGKPA